MAKVSVLFGLSCSIFDIILSRLIAVCRFEDNMAGVMILWTL